MTGFALFLLRRLLGIVVLVWVTTLVAFGLFRVGVPSQIADVQIDAQLGPGEPATWQYFHYLLRLLHGDLGQSLTVGLSVDTVLARAVPPTLSLMIGGVVLWLIIGILAGLASGLRAGSWIDRLLIGATLTTVVIPTFVLALLLLSVFSYTGFLWLQPGYVPFTQNPGAWLGRMILPWIAIAATQVGVTAKLTRNCVLETLGEDYIRTAHAKGLPKRRVFWLHILRPSIVALLPSVSVGLGTLLSGAAIVDQTFALGGVGQALLTAVKYNDLMVIMGTVLATVILISVVNLIADVAQALLDPRINLT
jgi:peptide/nickel transport system permease protein